MAALQLLAKVAAGSKRAAVPVATEPPAAKRSKHTALPVSLLPLIPVAPPLPPLPPRAAAAAAASVAIEEQMKTAEVQPVIDIKRCTDKCRANDDHTTPPTENWRVQTLIASVVPPEKQFDSYAVHREENAYGQPMHWTGKHTLQAMHDYLGNGYASYTGYHQALMKSIVVSCATCRCTLYTLDTPGGGFDLPSECDKPISALFPRGTEIVFRVLGTFTRLSQCKINVDVNIADEKWHKTASAFSNRETVEEFVQRMLLDAVDLDSSSREMVFSKFNVRDHIVVTDASGHHFDNDAWTQTLYSCFVLYRVERHETFRVPFAPHMLGAKVLIYFKDGSRSAFFSAVKSA